MLKVLLPLCMVQLMPIIMKMKKMAGECPISMIHMGRTARLQGLMEVFTTQECMDLRESFMIDLAVTHTSHARKTSQAMTPPASQKMIVADVSNHIMPIACLLKMMLMMSPMWSMDIAIF